MSDDNKQPVLLPPKIVRVEVDDQHYYFVNDEFFPSVTKILDEAGPVAWALKNWLLTNTPESANEIKTTTADFGTLMHDAYQRLLLGDEISLKDDFNNTKAKKHLMSFHRWFHEFAPDVNTMQTEHTVASVKNKFAGTLDLSCKKDGELWIIDFKTTSGIYYSHELQLTAYKIAYEELYKVKVDHVGILRTGTRHKSEFEFKEITREPQEFLNVYQTYLSLNGGEIPKPPDIKAYPDTIKLFEERS